MKRLLGIGCLVLAFTAAADGPQRRVDTDLGSDHFAAGSEVVVERPVAGDLIAAGGQLTVRAAVAGDAVLSGGEVRVDGPVGESLYLMGGKLVVNGAVGRNARVGGGQFELGAPAAVAGNLSVGGGDVRIQGRVNGYLQVAGGKVRIDGVVGGDVEARAGELTLGPNARITGKLRYASRSEIQRDPAAQIQGAVERIPVEGGWPMPDDMERGMGRSGGWIWTLGLLVLAGVLVTALPGFSGRLADTLRRRFLLSLLLGFVLLVCVPVAAVLVMLTLIGVPLGLLTMALYPALLLLGYVCSGVALGAWAGTRWQPSWSQGRVGRMATAMFGVLAIGLLARVPWLGGGVMAVALLAGVGALALQAWQASRKAA